MGVGVSKLDDGSYQQLNLFDDAMITAPESSSSSDLNGIQTPAADVEKQRKLDEMTSKLQAEFGKDIIKRGSSLK